MLVGQQAAYQCLVWRCTAASDMVSAGIVRLDIAVSPWSIS